MKVKPTLITGLQRSGNTWTAKMLLLSKQFFEVKEPLNILREELNYLDLQHQFLYINKTNESKFLGIIEPILGLSFSSKDLINLLGRSKKIKSIPYNLLRYISVSLNIKKNKFPLIKDPVAFMSSEWLAKTFNMNVVILSRHPAAYINSMKRMKWGFNFAWFAEQEELMEDYLKEFEKPIREYAKDKFIPFGIESQILVWNIQHKLILKFKKEHPEWFFYRHEDISLEPQKYFKKLYTDLGLQYTDEINNNILKFTLKSNRAEAKKGKQFDFMRDSKAITTLWKQHLPEDDIKKIYDGTFEICSKFYDESFW